ncbi:MAG: bifunctional adenosylcobinamide kinase/adenosylcobinamide-phosphate guanylyltransferase, partial [Chloroflexi bacterium]|nr:bifunctional adenosylcobinamide kinase/adenosylcobinamide-phosphate guanylyltransferase [Chloroflexota bacterium]
NEVGLGLVPDNTMGRLYRDLLGKANQRLAEQADEVYVIVAGLPLKIKPLPFAD